MKVAVGILLHDAWPASYREELVSLENQGVDVFYGKTSNVAWSAAFLWHRLFNPISKWAVEFGSAPSSQGAVVHFHDAWMSGTFLPLKPGACRLRSVCTFHGITGAPELRRQPLRRKLHASWALRASRFADQLTTVDAEGPVVAKELFGLNPSLFSVIPNGVEDIPSALGCPRLRERGNDFTIGHVASLSEGKGWSYTAAAVDILRDAGLPVSFLIAGDGEDRERVAKWCQSRPEYTSFLGHVKDPRRTVFPRLDVLVNPSTAEGLPMSLLEAFAAGVPAVATKVGGVREAVQQGRNGFHVERDADAIAAILRAIVTDQSLHRRLSESARKSYENHYTLDEMGRNYMCVYRHVWEST